MIDFVFLNGKSSNKSGIYKIWFGDHYYIGAALNFNERMKAHQDTLISAFYTGRRIGNNSTTKIVNHLLCNQHIKIAFVQILELCDTELSLVDAEHKWLYPCKNDSKCLNFSFKVHRNIGNVIFRPNGNFTVKSFCTKKIVRA